MKGERTPLSNGLLYGSVSGTFGGSLWAMFFSLPTDETLTVPRWILIGGGFLFWFVAGFLLGVFNTPRSANQIAPPAKTMLFLFQRMLVAVGWFFYRLLVGYFVGAVVTTIALIVFSLIFAAARLFLDLEKIPFDSPVPAAAAGSAMTGILCGFNGAIFGALIGTRRSSSSRPAIGSRAARSSFVSLLLGISFGAALRLPPDKEGMHFFVYLAVSIPISILAGILGGLWTDIRRVRDN
jgi:hypothetical protein